MNVRGHSIILSIIGIVALYFISILSQPIVVDLSELPDYENQNIIVKGTVKNHYLSKYGNHLITIEKDNYSAIVFAESETNVEYGDMIQATGKVQKYQDTWEIIVNNNRMIETIQKWENISTPLWEIAQKPSKYLDININTTGFIDSVFENHLRLTDADSKYFLPVFYDNVQSLDIYPGKEVTITGRFIFDENNLRYILSLFDEKHKIMPIEEGLKTC